MSGNHHGNTFGDTGPDEISYRRPPEVVNESFSGNPGLLASPLPGLVEGEDARSVVVEDIGAVRLLSAVFLPLLVKDSLEHLGEGNDPSVFVFGRPTIQPDRASLYIYPVPREGENLTMDTPAGVIGPRDRGTEAFR